MNYFIKLFGISPTLAKRYLGKRSCLSAKEGSYSIMHKDLLHHPRYFLYLHPHCLLHFLHSLHPHIFSFFITRFILISCPCFQLHLFLPQVAVHFRRGLVDQCSASKPKQNSAVSSMVRMCLST